MGFFRRKSAGFTLIELLVVVAIIGILASVVLASLNTVRAKARDVRRMTSLRELQKAVEFYYDKNGRYPVPSQGDGLWSGHCPSYGDNDIYIQNISEWMPNLPLDPKYDTGSQCFLYSTANNGQDYKLLAHGTTESVCPVPSSHSFFDPARSGQCTFQISTTWARTNL